MAAMVPTALPQNQAQVLSPTAASKPGGVVAAAVATNGGAGPKNMSLGALLSPTGSNVGPASKVDEIMESNRRIE